MNVVVAQLLPKGVLLASLPAATQKMLAEAVLLGNEIQSFLGVQCVPTSGMRLPADVQRLRDLGYNPSTTSDHFYGMAVAQPAGGVYTASIGAVDLGVPNLDKLFLKIVQYFASRKPVDRPRQLIYETGVHANGWHYNWLHYANIPSKVLSADVAASRLHRSPLLTSEDGGRTYQPYDPAHPRTLKV